VPEAEVRPRDDHLRADRTQELVGEPLGRQLGQLRRELDEERLLHPQRREQLEPAGDRRDQLDPLPEDLARVRVERDDRRREPGVDRRLEDRPMAEVDAVEHPERDGARLPLQLLRRPHDVHSRASASSAGMIRSGSASSTENGPISVRRKVRQ